jgi:hypothetical protein
MDFVSVRVVTHDVERLATFWERVTGLPVARPVPVFAELRTPTGTIAIGAPATGPSSAGATGPTPCSPRLARPCSCTATRTATTRCGTTTNSGWWLDFATVGAAEPEYELRGFPGPGMGPGLELLTAVMHHYQQVTGRQLSADRIMAWHPRRPSVTRCGTAKPESR